MYLTSGNGTNCPQDPSNQSSYLLDIVTETFINGQQAPFAADARAAGADVTQVTTCGVHTFGVWDRAFAAARAWGFFEPVPEQPRQWTYRTIATSGQMWGLDVRSAKPPDQVITFRRSGSTLTATGAREVRVGGDGGCRLRDPVVSCTLQAARGT
jgi:hypothetical protein